MGEHKTRASAKSKMTHVRQVQAQSGKGDASGRLLRRGRGSSRLYNGHAELMGAMRQRRGSPNPRHRAERRRALTAALNSAVNGAHAVMLPRSATIRVAVPAGSESGDAKRLAYAVHGALDAGADPARRDWQHEKNVMKRYRQGRVTLKRAAYLIVRPGGSFIDPISSDGFTGMKPRAPGGFGVL